MTEMQWRDISEAPKDGTEILVSGTAHGKRFNALVIWRDEWLLFDPWDDCYSVPMLGFDKWMPLPPHPPTMTHMREG